MTEPSAEARKRARSINCPHTSDDYIYVEPQPRWHCDECIARALAEKDAIWEKRLAVITPDWRDALPYETELELRQRISALEAKLAEVERERDASNDLAHDYQVRVRAAEAAHEDDHERRRAAEADLAAMRGAARETLRRMCLFFEAAGLTDTDEVREWRAILSTPDLVSSPGSAPVATQTAEAMPEGWRETAREMVEEYENVARANHGARHAPFGLVSLQFEGCLNGSCISARALLARAPKGLR